MRNDMETSAAEWIKTGKTNRGQLRSGSPEVTLGVLSLGHLLNDLYSNFLPQLLPFLLVILPGFSAAQAALLVASFNIASSLFQPVFGFMVDGRGHSWLIYV